MNGIRVLAARQDGLDGKALLALVDQLKNKLGSAVILLGGVQDDKVVLVAGVTGPDLAPEGRGSDEAGRCRVRRQGRWSPDMAQGGGTDAAKLDEALALACRLLSRHFD